MKNIMALVAALAVCTTLNAQRLSDEELFQRLTTEGSSVAALRSVLRDSRTFPSMILYVSSGVAFSGGRLEDAAFLFYIAGFRAQFDNELFPPTASGGDSPRVALGALHHMYGGMVNPVIVSEPDTMSRALARVRRWSPSAPRSYHPGWEYADKGNLRQALATLRTKKDEWLKGMSGTVTLMRDPAYYAAFKTGQDYNLKAGAPDRPSKDAFDEALRTMERIERERGIQGIASQLK